MPTLADIYSMIDSAKRRGTDFIRNPGTSLQQMVGNANDRARAQLESDRAATDEFLATRNLNGPLQMQNAMEFAQGYNPVGMTKVYRAGGQYGLTADRGGPTFYATKEEGAIPFSKYGPVREVEINPKNILDTSVIRMKKIYDEFLKETKHPAGYGPTMRPYWTAEHDFREWLKQKGHDYDAIMFDEPTGIPSIAVYGKHETK